MSKKDFAATPTSTHISFGKAKAPAVAHLDLEPGTQLSETIAVQAGQGADPPVAVLVCHGMGQQVRFETIGQLAASILREATAQGCTAIGTGVELAFQNDAFLARAELNWTTPSGRPHSTHVYEAYWAPITEGKVTYVDTLKFLFSAAWSGLRSSRLFRTCNFQRYMFGGLQSLPIYASTKVGLIAVSALLIAQIAAIAVVLAKVADQIKQIETAHFAIKQVIIILVPGIHWIFNTSLSRSQHIHAVLSLFGWYLLVAEILIARCFLIQYVGDVAAYISPYKDSKFDEIRSQIQAVGLNVAKVIYGFQGETAVPEYERVVVVGHSLGSVLAYDTLNAVINLDNTSATPGSRRVLARTSKLITFGSPLDKTAFLFRNQSNHVHDPLREQMACAFQPLIICYKQFRKPNFWTNIFSRMDIISGSLDYYDEPSLSPKSPLHVQNVEDTAANIALYAHVQYWVNPILAQTLYCAIK